MNIKIIVVMLIVASAGCAGQTPAEKLTANNDTNPRFDPAHPPHTGAEFYPKEALALNEEGQCNVGITIEADGSVSEKHIVRSTNSPQLDAACLYAFSAGVRFIPATSGGSRVRSQRVIPVVWCLNGHRCQLSK